MVILYKWIIWYKVAMEKYFLLKMKGYEVRLVYGSGRYWIRMARGSMILEAGGCDMEEAIEAGYKIIREMELGGVVRG